MNSLMTPYRIANCWAAAFAADRNLSAWAQGHYGKDFFIQIGADLRRQPELETAPFLVIFPDDSDTGPQRQSVETGLGLVAGIDDGEWLEEDGIRKLRGLARLDELAPLLESAMRLALPRAAISDFSVHNEISRWPLCMAVLDVTVGQSLPVGRR